MVEPFFTHDFDPCANKTGRVWHCMIPEAIVGEATYYSYTVDGPADQARGLRFDRDKVLLDPKARWISVTARAPLRIASWAARSATATYA